jgi:hypothetical protein
MKLTWNTVPDRFFSLRCSSCTAQPASTTPASVANSETQQHGGAHERAEKSAIARQRPWNAAHIELCECILSKRRKPNSPQPLLILDDTRRSALQHLPVYYFCCFLCHFVTVNSDAVMPCVISALPRQSRATQPGTRYAGCRAAVT